MPFVEETRHETIRALSLALLEAEVIKWEKAGWRRVGDVALVTPAAPTSPSYWAQVMARDAIPPVEPPPP